MNLKNKNIYIFSLVLILIAGLVFGYPFVLEKMAGILTVSDDLKKADAIVVLAGDPNGERVVEGVKLYKKGYAPLIVMSGGPLGWHLTAAGHMKKHAIHLGVPPENILIQTKSLSTLGDAIFTLPVLRKNNIESIILITSPYHMRRARRVFSKIVGRDGIKIISHPVENSTFSKSRWWERHEDTAAVVHEYVAWLGYLLKGF